MMVLKKLLQISLFSTLLLAACVRPTPTPTPPPGASTPYPSFPPTETPFPSNYPAPGASPTVLPSGPTEPPSPYPAATTGAALDYGVIVRAYSNGI
jgi:hypothetical protein